MYITYYDIKHVYLSKYSHLDKTTESRIDINYKSMTILVKTISTLGLVSEYHEFSITTKQVDHLQLRHSYSWQS